MPQHQPPISIANAAMPAAIPPPYRMTWRRLLAIVALGVTSTLFFSPIGVGPWWWQPVLVAAVLLVAVLLNAILTPRAGSGSSIGGALRGLVASGVVIGALGVAIIAAAGLSYTTHSAEYSYTSWAWGLLEAMLVAVLVGLVSALLAQSHLSWSLAVLGAILGWAAAMVANLPGIALGPSGSAASANGTQVSGLVISIALYTGGGGMTFALLGGLLGRGLSALAGNSAT
jgi:hypothetical protein